MKNLRSSRKIVFLLIIIFTVVLIGSTVDIYNEKNLARENREINLSKIEEECSNVYIDIEESETRYKELLSKEEDPFKRGLYCSALTRVYVSKNDYNKSIEYINKAVQNYMSIKGGAYYVIEEIKYLSWGLLRMGRYEDCFKSINYILEILSTSGTKVLTEEEENETEILIDTMFLLIYSEYKIMDKATIYYEKLCNMDITPKVEVKMGDKISFSKMIYAHELNDATLIKKYANECYEISLKKDKENGTNMASSVILNIAIADISLGEYDNAINTIKISEDFCNEIKSYSELTEVYSTYAKYYEKTGNIELANEYYKKAIYNESEYNSDFNLRDIIKEYIIFLEDNNLDNGEDYLYESFNKLSDKIGVNDSLDKLLIQITYQNEDLSNNRLSYIESQTKQNKEMASFVGCVIIILACTAIIMILLINNKNKIERKLEEIGRMDYLTGVNTRGYGEELILELINKNKEFSIGIIDIDNFKYINDTYGHIYGDKILKTLAHSVKVGLDENDILIRFGGEEFIIVFIDNTKVEAKEKLDKIRCEVNNIIFDENVKISFSGGIKDWDNTEIDKVIEAADKLLYEAKKQGKNKVII